MAKRSAAMLFVTMGGMNKLLTREQIIETSISWVLLAACPPVFHEASPARLRNKEEVSEVRNTTSYPLAWWVFHHG